MLARKDEFKLKEVTQGSNGVHLSAGPLEGMVELKRFFTDHESGETLELTDTLFGAQLAASGLSADGIASLATNPELEVDGDDKYKRDTPVSEPLPNMT